MADYPIFADVSQYIVEMLRGKMCPEPIPSGNNIQVTSPAEQDADYLLGLYLYDIVEDGNFSMPQTLRRGTTQQVKAPKPYKLHYMLFLNGSSQMGLKAGDTQKILGRAAQIVSDGGTVRPNDLQNWLEFEEPPIRIVASKMALEEKVRVWSAINKPYQVSLFYDVSPVYISSEKVTTHSLVTEAQFGINLKNSPENGDSGGDG